MSRFLHTSQDERVPVTVKVRNIIEKFTFNKGVGFRPPNVNTGIQGEEFFWEYCAPGSVKIWKHIGENIPNEEDYPVRWVSNSLYDVPFDCSFSGFNSDIKTVKTYRGYQVQRRSRVEILCTPRQARELDTFILVYVQEKPNKLSVQCCLCTKVN